MSRTLVLFEGSHRYLVQRLRYLGPLWDIEVAFDETVPFGRPIWDSMKELILTSPVIIVLVSYAFTQSAFCTNEVTYALENAPGIIISIFTDITPKELANKGSFWSQLSCLPGIDMARVPRSRL